MTPEHYITMLFFSAVLMDDYSVSTNHKRKRNQWRTRWIL